MFVAILLPLVFRRAPGTPEPDDLFLAVFESECTSNVLVA